MTSPPDAAEKPGDVPAPDERNLGVLLLFADPSPMRTLQKLLHGEGLRVDAVLDLAAARTAFFGAGGHDCLVVGPGVRPGLASRVAASLRRVDPGLALASFGPRLPNAPATRRTAMLASYHPGSRAGQGALLRFLRTL